ncbi:MAG: nitrilase-related carbon-nitrogen hydrolase [Thiotrichaceae bacterium]
MRLKGIVFGGRLPSLQRRLKKYGTIENYIEQVIGKKVRDTVLSFQLRNGFQVLGILPAYLPVDAHSLGYGIHLIWYNPKISHTEKDIDNKKKNYGERLPDTVRISTVQYMQRKVHSFDEFVSIVRYFVDVVANYKSDFVVFPELFSLQLLSIEPQELSPIEAIEALTKYTEPFKRAMCDMAIRYNINIIAGSHPTKVTNGRVENICYIFLRDGSIHEQAKIHPTPNEVYWWNIEGVTN